MALLHLPRSEMAAEFPIAGCEEKWEVRSWNRQKPSFAGIYRAGYWVFLCLSQYRSVSRNIDKIITKRGSKVRP
jgi:hypothetical protein